MNVMNKNMFDEYITRHRNMWLRIAELVASAKRVEDVYFLKQDYCKSTNFPIPINWCYACQCAHQTMTDLCSPILSMCKHCPFKWPSSGDANGEYMCEYNRDIPSKGNRYGLWGKLVFITDEYMDVQTELDKHPNSKVLRAKLTKLWKKEIKLCYKIATLPIDDSIAEMFV